MFLVLNLRHIVDGVCRWEVGGGVRWSVMAAEAGLWERRRAGRAARLREVGVSEADLDRSELGEA